MKFVCAEEENALFVSECDIRVIHVNTCADKKQRRNAG